MTTSIRFAQRINLRASSFFADESTMTRFLREPEGSSFWAGRRIRAQRSMLVTTTIWFATVSVPSPDNWSRASVATAAPSSLRCPTSSGAALVVEAFLADNCHRSKENYENEPQMNADRHRSELICEHPCLSWPIVFVSVSL